MLSPQIRARLEQLNRASLGDCDSIPARRGPSLWEPKAGLSPSHGVQRSTAPSSSGTQSGIATGIEISSAAGKCLMIDRPLSALWPGIDDVNSAACQGGAGGGSEPDAIHKSRAHAELAALREHFPLSTLFLDLETCGFAGSMVFLVGVVCRVENELVVRQLLARNYVEERAMLAALWPLVADHAVLCTFNGKAFDWPMVQDRSTLHKLGTVFSSRRAGVPIFVEQKWDCARSCPVHVDLLHHARRRWRRALPNCRLQTLETFICRRRRSGDIPGSDIPAAYHHYVRTGQTRHIDAILHHNALDLVTLAQLAARLVE